MMRPSIPTLSDDELSSDSDSDGEPDMPGGKTVKIWDYLFSPCAKQGEI